jgi:hypothetical protein
MSKADDGKNLGVLSNKVYDLLHGLEPGDRAKVMNSVSQLYADPPPAQNLGGRRDGQIPPSSGSGKPHAQHHGSTTPQSFFAAKSPINKVEMLAVAARFREQHGLGESHTVEDFVAFFRDARQNFDRAHFPRDIKNASHNAKLFVPGTTRGQYQLSYYGQQYVDALPDRDAAKKVKRPGRKRGTKAKSTAKKSSSK